MTPEQILRSAVSKLGPIAAANALTAFETGDEAWESCALARAYGADGELVREMRTRRGPLFCWLGDRLCQSDGRIGDVLLWFTHRTAAHILGLTTAETQAVTRAFDALGRPRRRLRDLLRAEASKIATVPSPARGSADAESEAAPDSLALVSR